MTSMRPFRIGFPRLSDAAPLIVAVERGYFAAEGIDVELSVEPSWSNISDKMSYGLLDGALMLPPLALALYLGLSGSAGPERVIVPMALSLNGITVTLSGHYIAAITGGDPASLAKLSAIETGRRFAAVVREGREKPLLSVVHTFSSHNLMLRYWLAAGGLDPQRDIAFSVVPPAQTRAALAEGQIDGFCAGPPWGAVSAFAGLGRTVATSHSIWNNGTEKVFGVRDLIAEEQPERLQAALRALLRAAIFCDQPANAPEIASIMAREEYLAVPAEILLTTLPGPAAGQAASDIIADRSVFFANAANYPWQSHARWYLRQMERWGYVERDAKSEAAIGIFRPDLYAEAARSLKLSVPTVSFKTEGVHSGRWLLPAAPSSIEMRSDLLLDGARFDEIA